MSDTPNAMSAEFFDATYSRNDDPWGFETRWYEKRKRAVTLAALPAERYSNALEIGSSIGVLTQALAERVDAILAVDISQAAVDRTRERLAGAAAAAAVAVTVERVDVAENFPEGQYDLVLLSEVGYYFSEDGLDRVLAGIRDSLTENGTVVACHWRHPVSDYPVSGDDVHRTLAAFALGAGWSLIAYHLEADFVLDVYSRNPNSVAETTGLL